VVRNAFLLLVFAPAAELSALTNASPLSSPAPSFYTTSFDCAKAKDFSVELAICEDEKLAKLDLEMADAYQKRLESASPSQKRELLLNQRKWLTIRNSYDANPYHSIPIGTLSDLSKFYRNRIEALRSNQAALLTTIKVPTQYDWAQTVVPKQFSRRFSIGRGYMSCTDPCAQKPSLYRLLSVGGGGIGEPPGDVDTPYAKIVHKLASEGWTKCRSADDSGKPTIDYFKKKDRMIAISRYHSMGAGNGLSLSITTSGPLAANPPEMPPNPAVTITSDWLTYSSPDEGFRVRYPPDWWMRDDSVPNFRAKYFTFGAKDYLGNFSISIEAKEFVNGQVVNKASEDPEQICGPSAYRISGFISRGCVSAWEVVESGTCRRSLASLNAETPSYYIGFRPATSIVDDSNQYKLTDLYEKILSTIELR
jgi:uncharacterized protein